jgi:dTDP-4-amino-4,6-dideoxygalactose transaminase
MRSVERLERRLAAFTGRSHCIAVGRGTTGLWLVMAALRNKQRNKIVVPATLCLSPAVVAHLCDMDLTFCDVQQSSGNICPARLEELLSSRSDICAVLAAHLFGQPADIVKIAKLCRSHGVHLIEDVAQALGAKIGSDRLGAFGDSAILSFGHTKILDAGDGGAVVTDDDDLAADLRAHRETIPEQPSQARTWAADYRKAYYAIAPLAHSQVRLRRLLGSLGDLFSEMYRYAMDSDTAERIDKMLDSLDSEIAHRRALAELYRKEFVGLSIGILDMHADGVPWRFNATVDPSCRDSLLDGLRAHGFDASSWYPALPPFFSDVPDWKKQWPAAAHIEDRIVNLWVDGKTSRETAAACCRSVAELLQMSKAGVS